MVHEEVITPWEQKGAVMRSLVEQTQGRNVELIDGIKVHHDTGWVLVLPGSGGADHPHPGRGRHPRTRRRNLAQEYARRIRQMLR